MSTSTLSHIIYLNLLIKVVWFYCYLVFVGDPRWTFAAPCVTLDAVYEAFAAGRGGRKQ